MKVIIPIAGRGSKFISSGYLEPKPLIMIKGKRMIKWATDSLQFLIFDKNIIFLVRKNHISEFNIDKRLKELYGSKITIISVDKITEGAVCTILLAKDLIDGDEELMIYNTDQYFENSIQQLIKNKNSNVKGIIPVFRATHQRWSYVQLDNDGYVIRTAEKEQISNLATIGLYYFSSGRDFVWAAEEMIKKDLRVQGEFYVCPVYNELIARGDKIVSHEIKKMWSLGTPEDVEYFKKYFRN